MAIPVYISRHQTLPDPYGALIPWNIGEKCLWKNKLGEFNEVYIRSKMMTHPQAPEINSAWGKGRYVYEVSKTPQGDKFAVRADSLYIHPTKR